MCGDLPFPETFGTLRAQFALLECGAKPAVLVPHWSPQWRPAAKHIAVATPAGTLFFQPGRFSPAEARAMVQQDRIGELLGYGTARKPERANQCLVLEDAAGSEIVAVVYDAGNERAIAVALEKMKQPGQAIHPRGAREIVIKRLSWWQNYFNQMED